MPQSRVSDEVILGSVVNWFETAVLGLNLCPFALKPYQQGKVFFEISHASDDETCLSDLYLQLNRLDQTPDIETLVLICSDWLIEFDDYNQFLTLADLLLEQEGWSDSYQIASFHPDYCFADCEFDDKANWTNRSPYPLLHLIRQQSISDAVSSDSAAATLADRNVEVMRQMTEQQMRHVFGFRYR